MAHSRKALRNAVVSAMSADLVPPFKAVYGYEPEDLREFPVLIVVSNGTQRLPIGQGVTTFLNRFVLLARIVSLAPRKEINWTSQQAEDKLDDLETALLEWVQQHMYNQPGWQVLRPAGVSRIMPMRLVNGTPVWVEAITLIAEVPDGYA